VLAARHDTPGDPAFRLGFMAGLELLRLGADGGDLLPVRKSLRQHAGILSGAPRCKGIATAVGDAASVNERGESS